MDYPAYFKEGDGDADLAASILGQGRVSRLTRSSSTKTDRAGCFAYQQPTMLGIGFRDRGYRTAGRYG